MTWKYILKEEDKGNIIDIIASLDDKQRKKLKKTLQSAEPTEFFGQDFTKLGELIEMMGTLNLVKSDKKLNKKVKSMDERNIDIVATATKLRKEYELLYRQLRDLIHPRRKGEEKK
jgi:hypothetical protein